MRRLTIVCLIIFGLGLGFSLKAQEGISVSQYNENSVKPIPKYEQFYKKRVWRRIDLKEKQNESFFAFNNEITRTIINGVKAGVLQPYDQPYDSVHNPMSLETFEKNLKLPGEEGGEDDFGFGDDSGWGDTGGDSGWGDTEDSGWGGDDSGWGETGDGGEGEGEDEGLEITTEFLPSQITILELVEDVIFDKRRSTLYHDIQVIKMIIPGSEFETGVQKVVASFKYKDLARLFRSMPEEAIWFNRQNSAEHRNLADAFALRLFSSRILKVENPKDAYLSDIYNRYPKQGIMASQWMEIQLMEKEHHLWEY